MHNLTLSSVMDLSAKDYIRLYLKDRGAIESATFIPPKVGGNGFGHVRVQFKPGKLHGAKSSIKSKF